MVILAHRDTKPGLIKQINFFGPSFDRLVLQTGVVLITRHFTIELGVEYVHLILALLRMLMDKCLIEFEPKQNQHVVKVLTGFEFIPLAPRYFYLVQSYTLSILELCHHTWLERVRLLYFTPVMLELKFYVGVFSRLHV